MHGHSLVSSLLVNAEVDSMGGVVDCGVDLEASPRLAAIEKAQADLRQEYDVREERRKQLEFLETGGNPLDYKGGNATATSVHSTSLTDQQVEQYGISEAKGSFALASSPHGDSVESSGRLGGSLGRESNIADNLLFFDGENSNAGGEKKPKRTGKRSSATPLEQTFKIDDCHNAKESEGSAALRTGLNSQAYARRNRSRSSRDSAHVSSTDIIPGHSNKSSVLPYLRSDSSDAKGLLFGVQPEDNATSSISNSKPASPNGNIGTKIFASDDQLDMELDPVQSPLKCSDRREGGILEEVKPSANLQGNDDDNHLSQVASEKFPNGTASQSSDVIGKDEAVSVGFLSAPGSTENTKEITIADKETDFTTGDKDATDLHDNRRMENSLSMAILNENNTKMEPSLVDTVSCIEGGTDGDVVMFRNDDRSADGENKELSAIQRNISVPDNDLSGEKDPISASNDNEPGSLNTFNRIKTEEESCASEIDLHGEEKPFCHPQSVKLYGGVIEKPQRVQVCDDSKAGIVTNTLVMPGYDASNTVLSDKGCTPTTEPQSNAENHPKFPDKTHEDAVLKEARIIQANLRRAGEPSMHTISSEKRDKCHWDFVLEEMTWMANDFIQERVWKTTAAAQVCRCISSRGRAMFEQENTCRKQRNIARTLAKAVMHFWHSAEVFRTSGKVLIGAQNSDLFKSWKVNGGDAEKEKGSSRAESEKSSQISQPAVQCYAVRFLDYVNSMSMHPILAEAPTTPERVNDGGILEVSWEDQLSEESLFYTVVPGAMQAYRESIETQWGHSKKTGILAHEDDCEGSMCDSVADGNRENQYEEDEGETGTYFSPAPYEGSLSYKIAHRKKKNLHQKSYTARSYEVGSDFSYEHYVDVKLGNQPLTFNGKRPSNVANVGSVPIKRVRTAARQRVASPFGAGVTGSLQVSSKTDVSSGDTNSFQDDQSSLHGGHHSRRNLEIESTADFERHVPYDSCEISSKPRKKKKPKHIGYKKSFNLTDSGVLIVSGKGSVYDQRLQENSIVQRDQRDFLKKRLESQHFESNGNSVGHYGQHASKKPKLKHLPEASPEAITPFIGSMPSPVASQMSNMSSPNKLFKLITNRDRGRKSKGIKMAGGHSGPGSPWSNFEDQALVVLVHDMGTNWELISDAINSTLQFKRIFRNPSECKDRHKFLMDKSNGDGADSAEDSGSSQPYPSTLPGIPKGSALQLFQRLQWPVEEDTLKAHFEKIILIGMKMHACRKQNDNQESKQKSEAHSSHIAALSQVCPNNLAGAVLTPLDLCDSITSSPDVLTHGYQASHTNGIAIPSNQTSVTPVLPTSNSNTGLQGSPNMTLGNSLPPLSAPLNGSAREAHRYGMPRASSLAVDEQQRMHQYNQMFSGRNIQQPSMSVPGTLPVGVERGVRMLPGGNGMGMMCGINRGMPMPRPGFQGMNPSGMLNMVSTGNMLPGCAVGMPNTINVHPGGISGPRNPMLRPRDPMQMTRPGQNEEHRQMMMQELPMQVPQGSGQSVTPFNGMSAPFSNATVPPPVQTFPVQQHPQSHQMPQQPHLLGNPHHTHIQATNRSSPQQQSYAIRFAKERQLQQRIAPQSQHSFSGSNAMPPIQNSSQIQQQAQSSSPGSQIASSQAPHKQQQIQRTPQSGNGVQNPIMKQRQRPQIQHQQPRPQQQQRQQTQQQAKLMKGLGRGSMYMHQNLSPIDGSHASGPSVAPKNQASEKNPMQQSEGFFPGNTALNTTLPQPLNQSKIFPRSLPQSSKQIPSMPFHPENPNQNVSQVPSSHALLGPQQPSVPSLPLATQQQQRQTNQIQQSAQRMAVHQGLPMNPDGRIQSSNEQTQVSQVIPTTAAQCTDSSAPVVSSAVQWKTEPSYDTGPPPTTTHLASSPQENRVGAEPLLPASSQGPVQRQFSGSVSMHKPGLGGQWQQQQHQQPQQPQEPQQAQHRQTATQGNICMRPSNSGPG